MAEKQYTVVGVDKHVYYGVCSTAAGVQVKEVVIQNPTLYIDSSTEDVEVLDLNVGDQLIVSFADGNTNESPTLSLFIEELSNNIGISDNAGRVVVDSRIDINCNLMWEAGEMVGFIYTERNNQAYWKMNTVGPAAEDRFGTVKIANSDTDINDLDDQTAVTYDLIKGLIKTSYEGLGLTWEDSAEEGEWGKVDLIYKNAYKKVDISSGNPASLGLYEIVNETYVPTMDTSVVEGKNYYTNVIDKATIPNIITQTGQLINNGDGTNGSVYLKNNDDISFIEPGMGIGYTYNVTEEEQEVVRNFIPYDPVVEKENNVRVGYGSLEAYQSETADVDGNLIELNPSTWIYGKTIYNGIDKNGSLQIGISDIPKNTFTPLYTFNKNGANFTKPLTVPSITAANGIDAGPITTTRLTVNGNATVTNTLNTKGLKVNGEEITALIKRLNPPRNVSVQAYSSDTTPSANFFVKRIKSPVMSAVSKGHFKISGNNSAHMQWAAPVINGYSAIGIVGFNLDQNTDKDWASHGGVWECYYQKSTNMIDFAIINWRDAAQAIYVFVDLLYVKTSWGIE